MIRTLIVDDELPARERLKRLLARIPDFELAGEAGSGSAALAMIEELEPDLVVLDITMPGMDGMALASALQKMDKAPEIIFCTAWPDQALEAFDRDAVDYLVKPVRLERLKTAWTKVSRLLGNVEGEQKEELLRSKIGGRTSLINLDQVVALVAEDKYTTVWFDGGKTVINDSLVELERKYPVQLVRVHRNTLVSSSRVRGMERSGSGKCFVLLEGTDLQPEVSRRQMSAIRRLIRSLV